MKPMRKLVALIAVATLGLLGLTSCTPPTNVAALITHVDSARSAYHLHDSAGQTMDTLKVVADPTTAGRFLGVYHTYTGSTYLSSVATSTDLKNWTYKRTFELDGSQPYIAFGPNNEPIIADEVFMNSHLRFFYWSSVAALLGTTGPVAQYDAARTLSSCAEGTPDIRDVTGSTMATSNIVVGHHYFSGCSTDREAVGLLVHFNSWGTNTYPDFDTALTNAGAPGKHGDRDVFTVGGNDYSIVEASTETSPSGFSFALWRSWLYDGDTATKETPITAGGSTAFANPSATEAVVNGVNSLIVTQFIPSSGAATGESGELIYWNPLP